VICSARGWTRSSTHELAQLAGKIDWDFIDGEITPLYSDSGRPGIAARFVIGFFLLKPTVLWSASVGAPSAFHPSPHWSARRPPLPRAGAGANPFGVAVRLRPSLEDQVAGGRRLTAFERPSRAGPTSYATSWPARSIFMPSTQNADMALSRPMGGSDVSGDSPSGQEHLSLWFARRRGL
jgi:hypothetical protein